MQERKLLERVSVLRVGSMVVELASQPPLDANPDAAQLTQQDIEHIVERRAEEKLANLIGASS